MHVVVTVTRKISMRRAPNLFSTDAEVYGEAYFGEGQGDIYIVNVECTGSEDRLEDCPASDVGDHDCSHSEDAGVACQGYYVL